MPRYRVTILKDFKPYGEPTTLEAPTAEEATEKVYGSHVSTEGGNHQICARVHRMDKAETPHTFFDLTL